ncbi:hypothetical protein EVAR_103595_1 [Eumeta japonica]|uniref:Uncharacterized protein n=1 Tax=Eumeta variegata TaxID=151549 RepID=A0A4C1ZCG1_EUMVA|nr:hypothetical protein EVAR_103595_1 [Eumeta japonica]
MQQLRPDAEGSRIYLTDDLREGRPFTLTTEDNASAVLLMIETDKRVSGLPADLDNLGHQYESSAQNSS